MQSKNYFYVYKLFIVITLLFFGLLSYAEKNPRTSQPRKTTQAVKITIAPKIDGSGEDSIWHTIPAISDFRQYKPLYDSDPSFRTEVKIAYDNYAIYVLAYMYDPNPDSILKQLGLRDEEHLNADLFTIEFDTYNNQLDAYTFTVSASGVQFDSRESDETYDAVWDSEASITSDGWIAELKIPYSALRFANTENQKWGMEIVRSIRRYRETIQWALEDPGAENDLPYWGILEGIHTIKPPVRLSATPYLLVQAEHFPNKTAEKDISSSFGGGMDLKYGINESFTLDLSLLPDFSQVQSDNKVKNLTAFETVYDEQRPFFNEAVDLFMKGDIFYSRRIGKTPTLFFAADDSLIEGEYITRNPVQQRLINSTKISGRNKNGLAIGFLNAITANTYAKIESEEGNERKILTDPTTNYNLIVLDQALKNNSNFYITNTNVIRSSNFRDANVTASGLTLNDKTNTYRIKLTAGLSQVFTSEPGSDSRAVNTKGFKYGINILKTKGNFQWSLNRQTMDNKFDANDMGLTRYNNYNSNSASISYNFYEPFWILRDMENTLTLSNQNNYTTHKPQTAQLEYRTFLTTLKYLSIWGGAGYAFSETYDYYEPRTPGMFYLNPEFIWVRLGFSSDYRKLFALDGGVNAYTSARDGSKGFNLQLSPIIRLNDHITLNLSSTYEKDMNAFGFAGRQDQLVIFGRREVNTVVNSISGKYLFNNSISISLKARHYNSQGQYDSYYTLLNTGYLEANPDYTGNQDFSYNSFNIDMILAWIFAPGSSLNFVWKNEIVSEKNNVAGNYIHNLNDTFAEPQLNNLSVKILYYIDYHRLTHK